MSGVKHLLTLKISVAIVSRFLLRFETEIFSVRDILQSGRPNWTVT